MKVIVFGCGRVGARVALHYAGEGAEVVVMDAYEENMKALGEGFKGERVVVAGISPELFRNAGVENADVFVATTDKDNLNLMAIQMARTMFKVKEVVARVYDPKKAEIFSKELSLKIFCPTDASVEEILNLLKE